MTSIRPLTELPEQVEELLELKDNPEEWYVLNGRPVGEYSVHTAETPEEIWEAEQELPPEERMADESVDGFYQIGSLGWAAEAFADDCNFVGEYTGGSNLGDLDTRVLGLLLVHESMLSDEALEIATRDDAPESEAPADD